MEALWATLRSVLELDTPSPTGAGAMALRAVVVYALTLVLVRLGSRRLLAKPSAFDVIVAIMLGSIMSRAITSQPFVPIVIAGALLLFMHWLLALLTFHVHWLSVALKGRRIELVRDGKILEDGMRRAKITKDDFAEALRLQVQDEDVSKVQAAHMERSGSISVIPRKR
jgi:uncharacterized membrane protein YcaP (DUF421 family)